MATELYILAVFTDTTIPYIQIVEKSLFQKKKLGGYYRFFNGAIFCRSIFRLDASLWPKND